MDQYNLFVLYTLIKQNLKGNSQYKFKTLISSQPLPFGLILVVYFQILHSLLLLFLIILLISRLDSELRRWIRSDRDYPLEPTQQESFHSKPMSGSDSSHHNKLLQEKYRDQPTRTATNTPAMAPKSSVVSGLKEKRSATRRKSFSNRYTIFLTSGALNRFIFVVFNYIFVFFPGHQKKVQSLAMKWNYLVPSPNFMITQHCLDPSNAEMILSMLFLSQVITFFCQLKPH